MRVLVVLMLFVCSVAQACSSFEECMGDKSYQIEENGRSLNLKQIHSSYLLRAIAYKLDEISKNLSLDEIDTSPKFEQCDKPGCLVLHPYRNKKLGPDQEELKKVIDIIHKEGGKVKGIDY